MKKILGFFLVAVLLSAGTVYGNEHPLMSLLPGRPMVILSAKDLGATYQRLASLDAVKEHATGRDREAFDDSKLALKLQDRIRQFSDFIGHPIRIETLLDLSGEHVALALYDIGALRFLIVSDLDQSGQASLAYLEKFESLDTRNIGGRIYYVKEDADKGLAFALYRSDHHVIASNDVNLVEGVLLNLENQGRADRFVDTDSWTEVSNLGDDVLDKPLLLYLDMESIKDDRYFQYYWIFRNTRDFISYRSVVCGIEVKKGELHERRIVFGPSAAEGNVLTAQGLAAAWWSAKGKGEALEKSVESYFGWPMAIRGKEPTPVKGRLVALRTDKQAESEIVRFAKGAAFLVDDEFSEEEFARGISRGIQEKLLIKKDGLMFDRDQGILSLNLIPSMHGAYLAKEGSILFAANDPDLLRELIKSVRRGPETMEEAVHVPYGDEMPRWAHAFEQMGPDAAFSDHETGYFFQGELADLLKAAAHFDRFFFQSSFSAEGILIQTVHYEK